MARLLHSYPVEPKLGAPIGLSPLAQPTTPGQLQVATHFGAAVQGRRVSEKRRFPPQWYEADQTKIAGGGIIVYAERSIGPDPPQVISQTPTFAGPQVTLAAQSRRITEKRRFPLQGFGEQLVRETGYTAASPATNASFIQSQWKPALGPKPPTVIGPLPSQQLQTIRVDMFAADARTRSHVRRFPKQWLEGSLTKVEKTGNAVLPSFERALGADPPAVISSAVVAAPPLTYTATGVLTNWRRAQQRRTTHFVRPPIGTFAAGFVAAPVNVNQATGLLVNQRRAQQRRPFSVLSPPTVSATGQIFFGPQINEVLIDRLGRRKRRQLPGSFLSQPVVVATSQIFFGPQVNEVLIDRLGRRKRRQLPGSFLAPPVVLQTFSGPTVTSVSVRTRIERQRRRLPDSFLSVPVVEPSLQPPDRRLEIAVTIARTRPRRTERILGALIFYPQTSDVSVALARIRPRPTTRRLSPPAIVEPYLRAPDRRLEVAVTVTRIRPHSKSVLLRSPSALQLFRGPSIYVVRTRPRATARLLSPPEAVRVPSVEQREDTVAVALVHTRPRPTTKALYAPTVLQTFRGPAVALTRTRPRPTTKAIFSPTELLVGSVEARLRTIAVSFTKTRPRPTARALFAPTVLSHPPVAPLFVKSVAVTARSDWKRRFPLQGWRQRLIHETGSAAGIGLQGFDPLLGPRPPQVVDPLPTQRVQTVTVTLAAVRTRVEQKRHTVGHSLGSPTKVIPLPTQRMQTVTVAAVAVRTRVEAQRRAARSRLPVTTFRAPVVTTVAVKLVAVRTRVEQQRRLARFSLGEPTVVAREAFFGPEVTLVKSRPRQTTHALFAPEALRVFAAAAVTLVSTRPRQTVWDIRPPATLEPESVEVSERTIRVVLAHTRPRPTEKAVFPPTALHVFAGAKATLARIRPRPTSKHLAAPAETLVPSVEQAEDTIRVLLSRTRPRRTEKQLLQPAALQTFTGAKVAFARTRPRATRSLRVVPSVVHGQPITTIAARLVATRPRPIRSFVSPPQAVLPLPTLAAETVKATFAGRTRLALPATHSRLFPPRVLIVSKAGVTFGEDWAATSTDGGDVGATVAPGAPVPGSSGPVVDSAAVESMVTDVAGTTVESSDKEAGT